MYWFYKYVCLSFFEKYSATDDTEKSIYTIFLIEVILIKNIEIDYINTREQLNDYDWTIACTYDQKVTDIILETNAAMNEFQFFSPIPNRIEQPNQSIRKTPDKILENQTLIINDKTNTNNTSKPNLNHHQILESMMIKRDEEFKEKFLNETISESLLLEKENNLKGTINEIFKEKQFTEYAIMKNVNLMTETHQILKEDSYKQLLKFHKIPMKSNMSVKQSMAARRKSPT